MAEWTSIFEADGGVCASWKKGVGGEAGAERVESVCEYKEKESSLVCFISLFPLSHNSEPFVDRENKYGL